MRVNYTVLGIDLTSTETRPSACLGLDNKLELTYFGFLANNSDIIATVNLYSPRVIAIDAPLSLPQGLCCLEENCECQPKSERKNRQCDQELRKQGIPCYPTSKKTFIKGLIYRGIELKTIITKRNSKHTDWGAKQSIQVIEVYPYASNVRLFGKTMPRKTTPQGITFLREKLENLLPCLKPYLSHFNHDLCDAAIAAYTAFLYCQNMVDALGNSQEGLIFIPHVAVQ